MIIRIKQLRTLPEYRLGVVFDDGRSVIYDVTEDMGLPGYDALRTVQGLFPQARLDESRTCVFWNDYIDLPSDIIYEYGQTWDRDFTRVTPDEAAALQQAELEIAAGELVSHDSINWD